MANSKRLWKRRREPARVATSMRPFPGRPNSLEYGLLSTEILLMLPLGTSSVSASTPSTTIFVPWASFATGSTKRLAIAKGSSFFVGRLFSSVGLIDRKRDRTRSRRHRDLILRTGLL